jgi:osmotically-inducible protein OsmY
MMTIAAAKLLSREAFQEQAVSIDGQLEQAVLMELRWEPSVTAAHIGVVASDGVVTLTGHVGTFGEKHAAQAAAWRVRGVRAVTEDIAVRLPFERTRGDGEIATAVLERLAWNPAVPPNAVTVTVAKGWITLTGAVSWRYQRDAAEQDVRRLHGVVGLLNQIVVRPTVNGKNTVEAIEQALDRAWMSRDHTIQVTADGGSIRLTGTVRAPHDRLVAERIAWGAPGATSVGNEIIIL